MAVNRLGTSLLALAVLGACTEDPNEAANAILVEMSQAYAEAKAIMDKESREAIQSRLDLLNGLLQSSDKIVAEYPEANVAVQFATQGAAGNIRLGEIKRLIAASETDLLCLDDAKGCVVELYASHVDDMMGSVSMLDRDNGPFTQLGLMVLVQHFAKAGDMERAEEFYNQLTSSSHRFRSLIALGRMQEAEQVEDTTIPLYAAQLVLAYLKSGDTAAAERHLAAATEFILPAEGYGVRSGSDSAATYIEILTAKGDKEGIKAYLASLVPAMKAHGALPEEYVEIISAVPSELQAEVAGPMFSAAMEIQPTSLNDGLGLICLAAMAGQSEKVAEYEERVFSQQSIEESKNLAARSAGQGQMAFQGLFSYRKCPQKHPLASDLYAATAAAIAERFSDHAANLFHYAGQPEEAYKLIRKGMDRMIEEESYGREYNMLFARIEPM